MSKLTDQLKTINKLSGCVKPPRALLTSGMSAVKRASKNSASSCYRKFWPSIVNVISFKLAKQDPWLCDSSQMFGDQYEEEKRLTDIVEHDKVHADSIKLLNWLFVLNTSKLIEQPQDKDKLSPSQAVDLLLEEEEESNQLEDSRVTSKGKTRIEYDLSCGQIIGCGNDKNKSNAQVPTTKTRNKKNARMRTLSRCISVLVMLALAYVTARMIVCAIAIFQHDALITSMRPELRRGASVNQTKRYGAEILCALKADIQYGDEFSEDELVQIGERLDWLGVPNRAQLGVSFLAISIILAGPLAFYCLPVAYVRHAAGRLRLDSVAFLYEPLRERARVQRELSRIIHELALTFSASRRLQRTTGHLLTTQEDHQVLSQHNVSQIESIKFLELLNDVLKQNLVRPLVICSQWHFDMQRWIKFMVWLFIAISTVMPNYGTVFTYFFELLIRANERYQLNECLKWNTRATIFKPAFYLVPPKQAADRKLLFSSSEELSAYEIHDGHNLLYLAYLALVYESSYFFTWQTCVFMLHLIVLIFFLSVWATFWTSIYVLCFLDKIGWLQQIRAQLTCCHKQVAGHLIQRTSKQISQCANRSYRKSYSKSYTMDEHEVELLLRRLTVAYVNYDLFRRQYKPFRQLTNFLVFVASAFSAASFLELYLIATYIETRFRFFSTFASFFVVAFMNIYLLVASYAAKLVESNVILLARLLALLAHYPSLAGKPTIKLWRRQLLSSAEVRHFASTRVLGVHVSYKQIIAFNVQLLGVWLLLWRVFNSKLYYS